MSAGRRRPGRRTGAGGSPLAGKPPPRVGARRPSLALAALLALASALSAQQNPNVGRGFAPEKAYELGDLDSINLFNGNLLIRIPLGGRYPVGGGLDYGLTLLYNGQLWDTEEDLALGTNRVMPGRYYNAGLGWTLSLGQLLDPADPTNDEAGWVYLSADGGQHRFYSTLHAGEGVTSGVFYTRDGSYLRLRTTPSLEIHFPDGTIHTFDYYSKPLADGSPRILHRPTWIEDPFGNYVAVTYPTARTWQITDSQGRSHTVIFEADGYYDEFGPGVVQSVDVAAFGNQRALYGFSYERPTINVGCPHTDPGTPPWETVPLLTRIDLPDGSSYDLPLADYSTPLGSTCDRLSGLLGGLTLPTLGRVEWDHAFYSFPSPAGNCQGFFYQTVGVRERRLRLRDGTLAGRRVYRQSFDDWACSPSAPNPAVEMTMLVVDGLDPATPASFPCGQQLTGCTCPDAETGPYLGCREHKFAAAQAPGSGFVDEEYGLPLTHLETDGPGWFLSTRTYEYRPAGGPELLRSTYLRYEWDQGGGGVFNPRHLNQRLAASRTRYHDDPSGQRAEVTHSDFDGLGHYRRSTTGGTFPAGNVRETFTRYNPDRGTYPHQGVGSTFSPWSTAKPWILGTYDEKTATEAGDTAVEQLCFDLDAAGYPTTGFLLRRRVQVGSSPGSHDVIEAFTADADGNVSRQQSYGGDLQTLSTGANLCALGLPVDQYRMDHTYQFGVLATSEYKTATGASLGFKTVERTIDRNTGLAVTSRDPAGLTTSYDYDLLGRLKRVFPSAGDDALTQIFYRRALPGLQARVQVVRRLIDDTTSDPLSDERIVFDDLGRVWHEDTVMPDGTRSRRTTAYNLAGWRASVSEVNTVGSGVAQTLFGDYDPFGRAGRITPPEGSHHDVEVTYLGARYVERRVKVGTGRSGGQPIETEAERREIYDPQGRLWRVWEPTGAGGALESTTYTYDVGNRLYQVAQGSSQRRWFTYDHRGFLLSEQHPEKGLSGGGLVTYSDYDARGHATRRQDGPFDLTFVYDRAERLVEVEETGGPTLKGFTYGQCPTSGTTLDHCNGKLVAAVRHNRYPGLNLEAAVTESYAYEGRQGRVSERQTDVSWGSLTGAEVPTGGPLIFADGFESGDTSAWSGTGGGESPADVAFTQGFAWSPLGRIAQLDYPRCTAGPCAASPGAARSVDFTYAKGLLAAVPGYADSITYHPNGLLAQIQDESGVTVTQDNDPDFQRRPRQITTAGGNRNWGSGLYQYDGAGNVVEMGEDWFVYDVVGRVTQSHVEDAPYQGGTEREQTYAYDRWGNILEIQTRSGGGPWEVRSLAVDPTSNRLTAAAYDAAGNLTAWGNDTYAYDPFGQMLQRHNLDGDWLYAYTADGERILAQDRTEDDETWSLRDLSGQVLTDYGASSGDWSLTRDYVHREGQMLASGFPGQPLTHYHLDHLGTPRLITGPPNQPDPTDPDPQATYLVGRHNYFAFGEESTDPQNTLRHRFTGHERDQAHTAQTADDLDYMHARYYNPQLGRFLSVDPAARRSPTKSPQQWNRYSYTANNPLKYIDPNGEYLVLANDKASQKLRKTLVRTLRRQFGRKLYTRLATDPNFEVRLQAKRLTSDKAIMDVRRQKADAQKIRFGQLGFIRGNDDKLIGVTLFLDREAIEVHPSDTSGIVTLSHEGDHAGAVLEALVSGESPEQAALAGDQPTSATGASEQFGEAVAQQEPDLTEEEAEALLDDFLSFTQRLLHGRPP